MRQPWLVAFRIAPKSREPHFIIHQICNLLVEKENHQTLERGLFAGMKECAGGICLFIDCVDRGVVVRSAAYCVAYCFQRREPERLGIELEGEVFGKTGLPLPLAPITVI